MWWRIVKWVAVGVWAAVTSFTCFVFYRCLTDEPIRRLPVLQDFVQGQALLFLVLAIFFGILAWLGWVQSSINDLREFATFYQPSSRLMPTHVKPGTEWFNNLFLEQEAVAKVARSLISSPGVLLIGPPRVGKTRCAYEALKRLPDFHVLGLSPQTRDLTKIKIPRTFDLLKPNLVVFLDDLQQFAGKFPPDQIVGHFEEQARTLTILATCRSGPELEMIKDNKAFAVFIRDLQQISIGRVEEKQEDDLKAVPESASKIEEQRAEPSPAAASLETAPSDVIAPSDQTVPPAEQEDAEGVEDGEHAADTEKQHGEATPSEPDLTQSHLDLALSPPPPPIETLADNVVPESAKEVEEQPPEAIAPSSSDAEADTHLDVALGEHTRTEEAKSESHEATPGAPNITEARDNLPLETDEHPPTEEAEETRREAIPSAPDLAEAHFDLGVTLGQEGHPEEAAKEFREAIRCNPDRAEAHYNLALALSQLGRTGEEERELREAIRCNPDYAEAHYNLAVVLRLQGRIEQAEKEFQEAIRCNPDLGKADE